MRSTRHRKKDPVPHPTSTNTNDVVRLCCACSRDSVAMISGNSNVALVYDLQKSSYHAAICRYSTRTASCIVFDKSSLSLSSSWVDVVNPDDNKYDAIFQRRIPVKTMIAVGVTVGNGISRIKFFLFVLSSYLFVEQIFMYKLKIHTEFLLRSARRIGFDIDTPCPATISNNQSHREITVVVNLELAP